jgi:hypothetical protein
MDRYLRKIGWEVDRKIDLMSGPVGLRGFMVSILGRKRPLDLNIRSFLEF